MHRHSHGNYKTIAFLTTYGTVLVVLASSAWGHEGEQERKAPLHFSHPLIAESPTPDTKVRFDYFFEDRAGEKSGTAHGARFEGEYAFNQSFSVELDVPFMATNPEEGLSEDRLGNVSAAIKYANFAFADSGIVLGGGLEVVLPTGNEEKGIGSDHVFEIEPSLDFGYKHDQLEVIAFTHFGFPVNENAEDEADWEFAWNLSVLYHLTDRVSGIIEFNGEHVFGGEEDGFSPVYVTPGAKFAPFANPNFQLGAGVSLPLTQDKEFHAMPIVSVFYHF